MPEPSPALAGLGWPLRFLAYAAVGAVAGLGQSPWGLWPLTLVALVAVMLFMAAEAGWKRAAFAGWAFGAGYFALTLHWIVQPFLIDIARHGWMAPFALVFMALGMALFWAAAGGIAAALGRGRAHPWAIVAGLGLAELTRSLVMTGFPWALLGHIWLDTPMVQIASYVGPHGLSLLTLAVPACAVSLWPRKLWLAAPLVLLGLGWLVLEPGPGADVQAQIEAGAPVVRLVQPNARQDSKWDPGMAETLFQRQLQLTTAGGDNADPDRVPDLVVWPETSVQWLLEYSEDVLRDVAVAARGAPVALGILRRDASRYFNSMVVVDRTGAVTDIYDKWHLVPFGEYVPLGELAARFGIRGLAASQGGGYSAGEGPGLVTIPGLGPAMPLICYEGIFPEEVNDAPERPRLLILITNDAWFGNWAGPEQHFAQARLRAIEQGLPLVRVANTGISGLIDPHGRVLGQLPLNLSGALDVPLPEAKPPTIYTKLGDWPAIVLLFILFLGLWLHRHRLGVDPIRRAA
ncbi:apolipoprotein N-acyltransferase [Flavimaricola marinus]|uniref:Apolipoprotein N-acyltransferase n=1 Tax=Flavimaricola marinus TaxID=1819565 RepID=A0A238LFK4_9RHOB|nr:apolipoprotein N-acyltransferase [Flavimaricola marinus]SMY08459.1 Apolipoprotein N-acyltransferase [Flavimaricola marinus]